MSVMNPPMPLRLLQPPLPLIGSHNGRELFLPCLRPSHWEICSFSCSLPSSTSAPICFKWFATQFVCGDHKDAVRFRIRNIYHPEQSGPLSSALLQHESLLDLGDPRPGGSEHLQPRPQTPDACKCEVNLFPGQCRSESSLTLQHSVIVNINYRTILVRWRIVNGRHIVATCKEHNHPRVTIIYGLGRCQVNKIR